MKVANLISQQWWKYFSATLLVVILSQFLAACQKSEAPAPAATPTGNNNNLLPQCGNANCANLNNLLLKGVRTQNASGSFLAAFDIYGGAVQVTQAFDPNKAILFYSGPVMLRANMRITAQNYSVCNATVGDYQVETVTPGVSQLGAMTNVRLEARHTNGNGRITMIIAQASLYNESSGVGVQNGVDTNRLGITNLFLESVNGQPCGTIATY